MEELIKKIPNWARWILVPFSSYAGGRLAPLLGSIIIEIILRLTGSSISWMLVSFMSDLRGLGVGFLIIYFGTLMAPSHKVMTGLVLAGLFTLSLFSLDYLFSLVYSRYSTYFAYFIGGLWVGVGFIAIQSRGRQPRNPNLG